ncbi:AAA family ATPase [Vibrio vulnificus]|nr:AAA family ATPase [Vibrio vulnificus]ELS0759377.1 AAA family ATPase [Vibrio vulnificus]
MRLVAIYVESHKALKQLTFNFDHRFDVTFKDRQLTINNTKVNNQSYYGENSSINLILGTNGVGKSTLLEVIEFAFLNEPFLGFHIWSEDDELYVFDSHCFINNEVINSEKNVVYESNYSLDKGCSLMKLSNVIDLNSYALSEKIKRNRSNYLNLTNNSFIRKSKKKIFSEDIINEISFVGKLESLNVLSSLRENNPSFKFIVNSYDFKIVQSLYNRNEISSIENLFDSDDHEHLRNWLGMDWFLSQEIEKTRRISQARFENDSYIGDYKEIKLNGFIVSFNDNTFLEFIRHIMKVINSSYSNMKFVSHWIDLAHVGLFFDTSVEFKKLLENRDNIAKLFIFALEYAYRVFRYDNNPSEILIDMLEDFGYYELYEEFLSPTFYLSNNKNKKYFTIIDTCLASVYGERHFNKSSVKGSNLALSLNDERSIYDVIDGVNNLEMKLLDYISFGWYGLSSGEEAIIKLLSRFSYGINLFNIQLKNSKRKTKIVLIDELDLYLNPQWQRSIVKDIFDVTSKVINEGDEIQFIITSHSPIIASDILPHDIIFMKHGDDGVLIDKEVKGFGSSVSELYFNSFNCNSTLGELSRAKIDSLIDRDIGEFTEDDERFIELIGNDFLKNELLKRARK